MNTSTSMMSSIFAGALILGIAGPANADRVFPPSHLAPNAQFPAGTASEQDVGDAWYQTQTAEQRDSLQANEIRERSPYPTMYYFVNIRGHANDERASLDRFEKVTNDTDVQVADESGIDDDNS